MYRTLIELGTDSIQVSVVLLDDVLRVHLGTDPVMNISTISIDGVWTRIVITFKLEDSEQTSMQISLYIDNENATSVEPIDYNFPSSLQNITVGREYSGFLQDFGIYLPALNESQLDQCLCYPNGIGNIDTSVCSNALESRY